MHSLMPYSIKVFDVDLPGAWDSKHHDLHNIRSVDLLTRLGVFFSSKTDGYHVLDGDHENKTIKFTNVNTQGRYIYGFAEYGEYGIKGKVVDINTGTTVHDKQKHESDIQQLYFCFHVPVDQKIGSALFHNIHGRGVKTIIENLFNQEFSQEMNGLRVKINPMTYDKAVEDWLDKSVVKELKLTKFNNVPSISSDISDQLGDHFTEITIKPTKKGMHFGAFTSFRKTKQDSGDKRSLVDMVGQQCHEVKAVVEFNGKKRTFTLKADSVPTSSVEFGEADVTMVDGAPEIDSLHEYAISLLEDMTKQL